MNFIHFNSEFDFFNTFSFVLFFLLQVILIGDADDPAVISVSDDRTIRVWARRDTGQYWPSVCHTMPSAASAMDFDPASRRLFVAMDNGSITEFELADDLNKITFRRFVECGSPRWILHHTLNVTRD